jgi:hypothetical protein
MTKELNFTFLKNESITSGETFMNSIQKTKNERERDPKILETNLSYELIGNLKIFSLIEKPSFRFF